MPLVIQRAGHKAMRYWVERRATDAYFISADTLDGFYGEQAIIARLAGMRRLGENGTRVHIVGFSWGHSSQAVVQALHDIPNVRFSARDPISFERFQSQTGLPVQRGSDIAYLVSQITPPAAELVAQIDKWRASGLAVVGLTPNGLWQGRLPHMHESLSRFMQHRRMRDAAFVLVPHDRRPAQEDYSLCVQIKAGAGPAASGRIIVADLHSYAAGRGILASVDLHLSGRMHAGISAMSVTTPAVMISVQEKMLGVLQDAGQDDLAVSPERLADTDQFVTDTLAVLAGAPARRTALAGRVAGLRANALSGLLGPDVASAIPGSR
jgi:polysaccharide pyruvyl transferase WcaK-like protein